MIRIIFIFSFLFTGGSVINAQVPGCTDPQASNYNIAAEVNDGSCTYAPQTYTPQQVAVLSSTLKEISGIVYFQGKLLALNDGGNSNQLYFLDTTNGAILQTITIEGATNIDWEDLAQDSNYIYIEDAGNNEHGNRTDLCIYRIDKTAFSGTGNFTIASSLVQKINFTYPDQNDFTSKPSNSTRFDCEALLYLDGKLHLFTKNWIGNYSVHYSIPIIPGNHIATRLDSLNTAGMLITGADAGANDEIILTAYSTTSLACSLYLVYGFEHAENCFDTGNKRQVQLPLVLGFSAASSGQLESVCFVNGTHGFIANEYISRSVVTVTNKLHRFSVTQLIVDYYEHNQSTIAEQGMIRYNSTLDQYEVYTGLLWEALN